MRLRTPDYHAGTVETMRGTMRGFRRSRQTRMSNPSLRVATRSPWGLRKMTVSGTDSAQAANRRWARQNQRAMANAVRPFWHYRANGDRIRPSFTDGQDESLRSTRSSKRAANGSTSSGFLGGMTTRPNLRSTAARLGDQLLCETRLADAGPRIARRGATGRRPRGRRNKQRQAEVTCLPSRGSPTRHGLARRSRRRRRSPRR